MAIEQGRPWSSDLSAAELAILRESGFEPVGLVMGSSVYQLGVQSQMGASLSSSWRGYGPGNSPTGGAAYAVEYPCPHGYFAGGLDHYSGFNWERTDVEAGLTEAYYLARSRMEQEAKDNAAHGVVGVHLTLRPVGGMWHVLEFTMIGTAVRREGSAPLDAPFSSNLSVQDFAKLLVTGYVPADFVIGVGVVQASGGCGLEYQLRSWNDQDITQFSDAIQESRRQATRHLEHEGSRKGEGVIGVEMRFSSFELGERVRYIQTIAVGTSVLRFAEVPLPNPPLILMPLVDRDANEGLQ